MNLVKELRCYTLKKSTLEVKLKIKVDLFHYMQIINPSGNEKTCKYRSMLKEEKRHKDMTTV